MSRVTHEQNVRIYFLPTVANIQAPTVAEITAGTEVSAWVTKDGVALGSSENLVDNGSITTAFDAQSIGSWGMSPAITFFRDDTDEEDTFELFTRGLEGYLMRSPFGAPVALKAVEVYPVEVGITQFANSAANENQKYTVNFAVTREPALRAVVAAA